MQKKWVAKNYSIMFRNPLRTKTPTTLTPLCYEDFAIILTSNRSTIRRDQAGPADYGLHTGSSSSEGCVVERTRFVPSNRTVYNSQFPSRSVSKTMRVPSPDQEAWNSSPGPLTRRVGFDPSRLMR